MEEALIEVPTMRRFAGIELINDRIPHEATFRTFRDLLEKHDLGEQIYCCADDFVYETVKAHLSERGMTMRHGTIVDATIACEARSPAGLLSLSRSTGVNLIMSNCQVPGSNSAKKKINTSKGRSLLASRL